MEHASEVHRSDLSDLSGWFGGIIKPVIGRYVYLLVLLLWDTEYRPTGFLGNPLYATRLWKL